MNIRAISLNIWCGRLLSNTIDFLKKENADILLLQEVFSSDDESLAPRFRSKEVLESELGFVYSDFAPNYRDFDHTKGEAQRGSAIFSKFPITERRVHDIIIPYNENYRDIPGNFHNCPRNLQYVKVQAGELEVNVFNIHGPWDLDGDNFNEHRQEMAEIILRETKGKNNVVLGGDTNATPGNQAIELIKGQLNSVFGDELKTTFNMQHKTDPGYATAVVDYIFVSKDVKAVAKRYSNDDVSDHLALIADLKIFNGGGAGI